MKYLSTTFVISIDNQELMQPCRELLADACCECGYESFEDTDEGIIGYIQEQLYSELMVNDVINNFAIADAGIAFSTEEIPDQDWNAAWEEIGFEPIIVDGLVTIYDARNTEDATRFSTPIQVGIHATNAFGTGTHETTRMIVSTLLRTKLEGRRVLDCGCGTGILAITALKCGAAKALGYDIDEWSADNARHNADLNGVGDSMEVLLGNGGLLSHIEGVFDVVLANINRNILLEDMEHFHSAMANDGLLVLSGFYEDDAPLLIEKAATLGMKESRRMTEGSWCCLVLENA